MTEVEELRKKIVCILQDDNTLDLTVGTDMGPIILKIAELAADHFCGDNKMKTEVTLDEVAQATFKAHEDVMRLHFRAMACHCECLGMNAENSYAICLGKQIPHNGEAYQYTMQKWGLINGDGDVTI